MFSRVVLPAPDAPIIKQVSPGIANPVTPFNIYLPLPFSFFPGTVYVKSLKDILIGC